MEHTPHALDYLSVVRRRRWWLILPLIASVLVGVALVMVLPKQYRAKATLGVAAPAVSPSLVNQAAVLDTQERLRAITHQLLSDEVLRRVIASETLAEGDEAVAREIARLRSAVETSVPDPVARAAVDARHFDIFEISYTDNDPARAQRVTNRLAEAFIDEVSRTRTSSAERSAEYLAQERERARARLAELETKLREAKEAYIGRLPEQTPANLQTLASLRQQLEMNGTNLRHQQDRLALIERQIEAMEQQAANGNGAGAAAAGAPDRVLTLERELAVARTRYTDRHPEVQRLEAELEKALAAPAESTRARATIDYKERLQFDPAYKQLVTDRETTRLAIRDLEHAGATIRAQIADYQQRVEQAPMVEQQLAAVQREFDLARQYYNDVSARYTNALMAESVTRNRDGERFTIVFPASLPTEPESPIPARVMLIAVLAGICLGGALALGREYLDRSVYSIHDLASDVDVPVLGEVAHIPGSTR